MPDYEYRCLDCERRFIFFMRYDEYGTKEVVCAHCGSSHVQRKIGRIRIGRSEESRLESLADPQKLAAIDDDPRALGKMMREMSSEIGEDMGGEFDEVVGRLEAGQSPDDIERDIPNLGGDSESGMDMGMGFDA